ncbi:hypothetical protein ACFL6G_07125 [candidate division KSB1 bacterium]
MKKVFLLFILIIWCAAASAQEKAGIREFSDYQKMRQYFGSLYQQKKFNEAAELLEMHLDRFPENVEANTYNLAITYAQLKKYKEGIKSLQYGHEQGVWYNKYAFMQEFWAPFREYDAFDKILKRNEELRQEALKSSAPDLLVVTPEGFDPGKKYPLFIALHGGSSNIENFKSAWISEKMKSEFIIAYVQSSLLVSMNSYSWTENMEVSKKEITNAYNKVRTEYSIDETQIVIGGFSAGGVAAMEITFCDLIPVSGFIALCPAKPQSFTDENLIKAKDRGVRGVIITSEMDPRLPVQKEMVEVLKNTGFQYQFIVTPNIGHWFPEDMDIKIDISIEHIRNK